MSAAHTGPWLVFSLREIKNGTGFERNAQFVTLKNALEVLTQLEREQMRLAACGVVALANTPESAAKARDMKPEYRSASCDHVARAVDREMELKSWQADVTVAYGSGYGGARFDEVSDGVRKLRKSNDALREALEIVLVQFGEYKDGDGAAKFHAVNIAADALALYHV